MSDFEMLFAVSHKQTLKFFAERFQEISDEPLEKVELMYNASLHAHYSQVSTFSETEFPMLQNLSVLFDKFVYDTSMQRDAKMMETAAAQCLIFSGFFEAQQGRRHNIKWYAQIGQGFYEKAAGLSASKQEAQLFHLMNYKFEWWRKKHFELSQDFRERPYLLRLPPAEGL